MHTRQSYEYLGKNPGARKPDANSRTGGVHEKQRIAAVEEHMSVDKRTVETGAARVRKVVSEEVQGLPVRLRVQQVNVRHVPVNQHVEKRCGPRREGATVVIPIYEYVPVVMMQLVLKEEVHLTTVETETDAVHEVPVRSEKVVVERRESADGVWRPDPEGA
jgi:stress response protein YsnF